MNYEKRKKVTIQCVYVKIIRDFFNELSDLVIVDHKKVWGNRGANGITNFIIGSKSICVSGFEKEGAMETDHNPNIEINDIILTTKSIEATKDLQENSFPYYLEMIEIVKRRYLTMFQ